MIATRMRWLMRRLSRMYWQEIPFRLHSVLRGLAQSRGWFSANSVPQQDSSAIDGQAWCRTPTGTSDSAAIVRRADRLLNGELVIFGRPVRFNVNGAPEWNTDPVTGIQIPPTFGPFIDFRHIGSGIDIKHLWELNRHLWWVQIAQAWALTKDFRYLERLGVLIASWTDNCPYQRGPNWTSPVEHSIRLINWSLVWFLIGGERSPLFHGERGEVLRIRWLDSVYQHIRFCSDNYSYYSSADNHLIGEAAGIFVAAHTWDYWIETRRLRTEAKKILEFECRRQFSVDGVNLEQALCYQKFSLQFLLASGLTGSANKDDFSDAFWTRIESAMVYLAAVTDCVGSVPKYGDADDGEVWHLGGGDQFDSYRAMLSIGSALFTHRALHAKVAGLGAGADIELPWLRLPERRTSVPPDEALPTLFAVGGYCLLGLRLHSQDELRVFMDCGPLGFNRVGGHEHADALSVMLSCAGEPLLVDAGTYCYNAAPAMRHFFRGTHAHNTLVVDDQDQSVYGASFLWLQDLKTTIEEFNSDGGGMIHAHHNGYLRLPDPVRHHRRVQVCDDYSVLVEDWLDCAATHEVSLLWHCAAGTRLSHEADERTWQLESDRHLVKFRLAGPKLIAETVIGQESPPQGWVSNAFYAKEAAPVLRVNARMGKGEVLRTHISVMPRHL